MYQKKNLTKPPFFNMNLSIIKNPLYVSFHIYIYAKTTAYSIFLEKVLLRHQACMSILFFRQNVMKATLGTVRWTFHSLKQ